MTLSKICGEREVECDVTSRTSFLLAGESASYAAWRREGTARARRKNSQHGKTSHIFTVSCCFFSFKSNICNSYMNMLHLHTGMRMHTFCMFCFKLNYYILSCIHSLRAYVISFSAYICLYRLFSAGCKCIVSLSDIVTRKETDERHRPP